MLCKIQLIIFSFPLSANENETIVDRAYSMICNNHSVLHC